MSHRLTPVLLLAAVGLCLPAAPAAAAGPKATPIPRVPADRPSTEDLAKVFEARTFASEQGGTLGYRLFKPAGYDATKKYPLVLFLHGAGERGADNKVQLKHFVWRLVAKATQAEHPCFVAVPQCPRTAGRFVLAGRGRRGGIRVRPSAATARAEWKAFRIEPGRTSKGKKRCLTFYTLAGRGGGAADSAYRNVKVYEAGGAGAKALSFQDLKLTDYKGGALPQGATVSADGTTLTLKAASGGPLVGVRAEMPYTVTDKTVLELEFKSTSAGEAHLIGLDETAEVALSWWSALDPGTRRLLDEPAMPMRLTLEMLAALAKEFSLDADRVYVGGLSMGGFGTWDVILRHPKRFAAAFPICGGGDATKAARIAHLPIWVFHGGADGTVRPEMSRQMMAALENAGAKHAKYTEYPGVGHNSWDPASAEPEFVPWLFSQKRK